MEPRRSMNDIIVHKTDDRPLLQSARPKRSIREITRGNDTPSGIKKGIAPIFDEARIEERRKEEVRRFKIFFNSPIFLLKSQPVCK